MAEPRVAPEGKVWVCMACGKRSRDRHGPSDINRLWDESCMLNAELIDEDRLELVPNWDGTERIVRSVKP